MKKQILLMYQNLKMRPRFPGNVLVLLLMLLATSAFSQTLVSGKVSDETGQGMPGVNVLIKGTAAGTVTDNAGAYSISIPGDQQKILVFSFIGYTSQEVAVGERTAVDVAMKPDATQLSEVVVVGYGTQKKSDITGAMSQLSDASMKDVAVSTPLQALQGRVAGVDVSSLSPRPGGDMRIRIRGTRSFTADANDPLIVVDGIPFTGTLNDLNVNDIVSMDVLKDASATAIYGSRGSNGVILVTTRGGKKGKTVLSYDGYYGTNSAIGQYNMMNANQYNDFRNQAVAAGATYAPTASEVTNFANGKSVDWQKEMYQKGYITNHSLSAAGGTDDTQYSVSAGYFKQTSVMPGQAQTRYSLATRVDQKIGNRIKVGVSTNNTLNITDGENINPMFQILTLSPSYSAYNPDGSINHLPAIGSVDATTRSPLLINDQSNWKQQRRRLRTFNSLYGEVNILDGLKYRINVGLDYWTDTYGQYAGSETPFQNGATNRADVTNQTSGSYTIENLVTYDKTFADVHKLQVTGLYSVQSVETYTSSMSGTDLPSDGSYYYNLGLANNQIINNGSYQKYGLVSFMGRVNYSFNDRFLATFTIRRDGSSRLAEGHQYFNYPAGALSWNIKKESFMANVTPISTLKLRLSAGQTSNQAIAPYSSLGALSKAPYNFGTAGLFGYGVSSLPNPNLSWEFTTSYNVGLDFGFLGNRITGSVEFYKQLSSDILQPVNLPPTSGVSSVTQNIGKSENNGVELTLSAAIIDSKTPGGFTWSADVNWFAYTQKITELGSGITQDVNNGWFVGSPVDAIFDYKKIGIWQTTDVAAAALVSQVPGQIRVADLNGDGKIDANDRSVLGSLVPNWQGGMTNRFSYKGFSLDITLFAKVGGMLVSTLYQANQNNAYNTLEGRRNAPVVDYWTPTNPTNAYPRPGLAQQPIYGSTTGYFDATFMKIRSINLAYQIPQAWLGKTGLSSVKIYFQAQNPFKAFFSPYVDAGGLDPEATATGDPFKTGTSSSNTPGWGNRPVVAPNTPPVKQFIIGLNIKY